jgi:WD40 repeat protein
MLSDTGVALILKTLATQPDGTQVALPAEDPALREDKTAFAKDIHDLGLIFFDLLAHTPFDPDDPSSPSSQLHKILRSRSSAKRPPDLPREVLIFINKVFAYKEFSPYESISKLAADLEKIVLGTFRLVDIAKQVPQPSDRPLPRKTTRIFEVTYDELIEKPKVKQKGVVLWVLLALAGFLLLTFATALVLPRQTTLIFLNTMGLIDTSTPTMSPTIRIVSSSTPTSSRTPAPTLTATLYFTPTPSLTPTITLTYTPMFEKISINNAARISQRVRIDISGGNSVLGLAFSPDSQLIAAALEGGSAILYHVRDGTSLTSLNQTISCIAWSPDGKMIAGGGADGSIYIWSMPDAALVRTLSGHHEAITSLAFSPDSQTLASGSADDTVRLWPMGSTSAPRVLYGHTGDVTSVSFSANGAVLASGSLDTTMRLYSGSGDYLRFLTSEHHILSVALSPDGTRLLAASTNSSIRLFDVANIDRAGLLNVVLEGPGNDTTLNRINSVAFSPDGLIAVIGMEPYVRMENSTLLLVYIEGNRYLKSWAGHTKSVNSVTFSPDGTMLASGSTDGTLRIWGIVR